jgi:hypothetical protein
VELGVEGHGTWDFQQKGIIPARPPCLSHYPANAIGVGDVRPLATATKYIRG